MAILAVIDGNQTDSDRSFGYRFGSDGIVTVEDVCKMLAISERTLFRRVAEDRSGKKKFVRVGDEGGRAVFCRRSLTDYIASLER